MSEELQSFLRLKQVKVLVGLSRSTIYARIKRGDFPHPVSIGLRAVAWPSSAIVAWQAQQIEHSRRVGVGAPEAEQAPTVQVAS